MKLSEIKATKCSRRNINTATFCDFLWICVFIFISLFKNEKLILRLNVNSEWKRLFLVIVVKTQISKCTNNYLKRIELKNKNQIMVVDILGMF